MQLGGGRLGGPLLPRPNKDGAGRFPGASLSRHPALIKRLAEYTDLVIGPACTNPAPFEPACGRAQVSMSQAGGPSGSSDPIHLLSQLLYAEVSVSRATRSDSFLHLPDHLGHNLRSYDDTGNQRLPNYARGAVALRRGWDGSVSLETPDTA